jgi:hypothetical protein
MRSRDAKDPLTVQRTSHPAQPAEYDTTEQTRKCSSCSEYDRRNEQPTQLLEPSPSCTISTERIMQAVEQQRRITQQLDDLCTKQQQRAVRLYRTSLKFLLGMSLSFGILASVFIVLSLIQPDILVQLLAKLSDTIAILVAVEEGIKTTLSLIPSNSWLLSGAALVIVLMVGMWLRLMRYPQKV